MLFVYAPRHAPRRAPLRTVPFVSIFIRTSLVSLATAANYPFLIVAPFTIFRPARVYWIESDKRLTLFDFYSY